MATHPQQQPGGDSRPDDPLAGFDPVDLLMQGAGDTHTEGGKGTFDPPTIGELASLFPRFSIQRLIGRGGMGAVYEVRQLELDRTVALKILPPEIGGRPGFSDRFAREAKALAKLNHPGIVTLHEFGQAGGLHFILMEYVDGASLRDLLEHGRISPREALAIVPQICDALQYAHDHGIIHRDIKPENILLDRLGRVKVADFGLAKLAESADEASATSATGGSFHLTEIGKVMGTPSYMAPEQLSSPGRVDHRADIYALGVVFYQMLTGQLPDKALEAPSSKVRLDVRLDEVVLRALQAKPELRFQQASIMKTQVEGLHPSMAPQAAASNPWNLDHRSKATLFGLPLLHVTSGPDPETGQERIAKGIIAIGGRARGVLAIGGTAFGFIAMGGFATGVISFGGFATGLFAFGGLSAGLVGALGGMAVAPVAVGGAALGYYSFAGSAFGVHALGSNANDPEARAFFRPWGPAMLNHVGWILTALMAFVFLVGFGVPMWVQRNLTRGGEMRRQDRRRGILTIVLVAVPTFIFAFVYTQFVSRPEKREPSTPRVLLVQPTPATPVPIPVSESETIVPPTADAPLPESVSLEVREDGTIRMNGETLELAELTSKLAGWVARKSDLRVTIHADQSVKYERMMEIVDGCGKAGAYNLAFGEKSAATPEHRYLDLMLEGAELEAMYQPGHAKRAAYGTKVEEFLRQNPGIPGGSTRELAKQMRPGQMQELSTLMKDLSPQNPDIFAAHRRLRVLEEMEELSGDELQIEISRVIKAGNLPKENRLEIRKVTPGDPSAVKMKVTVNSSEGDHVVEVGVSPEIIVSGLNVRQAEPAKFEGMGDGLEITLDKVGGRRLAEATRNTDGGLRLAILIDGEIHYTPLVVQGPLGNKLQITNLSENKAIDLMMSFPYLRLRPQAAEAWLWLTKIDARMYDESYADLFQVARDSATVEQWQLTMKTFREPLGALITRLPKKMDERTVLPGMPDGEYRIWQFETDFENKKKAVETVTMAKENGVWKPMGYFIR
ncbi:protein kinase [Luteolibacter sp. SL250]|uniref:protein kinase domain-containing protein n=1 Tax=Luteolibacter sp. SL250 TaxID=2995170 RepID=UPI002270082B|nr:protein kinase [Luteolibacter sp. SL250]WAC18275.1 protein kinase [Luteolibacter sp. SL250]